MERQGHTHSRLAGIEAARVVMEDEALTVATHRRAVKEVEVPIAAAL
jgi:hypothetical protein